jgi:hypothetical protein
MKSRLANPMFQIEWDIRSPQGRQVSVDLLGYDPGVTRTEQCLNCQSKIESYWQSNSIESLRRHLLETPSQSCPDQFEVYQSNGR